MKSLQSQLRFVLLVLCGMLLLPQILFAAKYNDTTNLTTDTLTMPMAHDNYNAWIYTKKDSTGYIQVYMQYFPALDTDPTHTLTETALTTSKFDKYLPRWGAEVNIMSYYATSTSAVATCTTGELFYYTGDGDASGSKNLYLGCMEGLTTATPTVPLVDVKLTGITSRTTYDVSEFDVTSSATGEFQSGLLFFKTTHYAYNIVFTDSDGHLHFLMHDQIELHGYSGGLGVGITSMAYDYEGSVSIGTFAWTTYLSTQTKTYASPVFDNSDQYYIAFLYKDSTATNYDVGTVSFFGDGTTEKQLTDLSSNISHPQFFRNNVSSDSLFFEYPETSSAKARIIHLPISVDSTARTISSWCDTVRVISEDTSSRRALDANINAGKSSKIPFVYAKTQPDDKRDIYGVASELLACGTGTNDIHGLGGSMPASPTAATTEYDYSDSGSAGYCAADPTSVYCQPIRTDNEIQLTCLNDNQFPMFMANSYRDSSFVAGSSSYGFTDVIFMRDMSDGTGDKLVNIYDVDNPTDECDDTCYENSDGSAIDDNNSYLDTDGIKDSCESNIPCSATFLTATPTEDYDSDGIANASDNCACSYNPSQYDGDLDGVGEVYLTENGCDNCAGVSNPADMDNNGDGKTGLTTFSDGYIDGDVRQTDTDGDGYGDACDVAEDPCGTKDRDADGVYDYCDNCIAAYNPSQEDTNSDGTGDACTVTVTTSTTTETTTTTVYPCEVGNDDYLFDTNNDGVNDSCTEILTYPCETGNQNYLYDTNSDGVKDSCFPCAGGTIYISDISGDGVNDSCLAAEVTLPEPGGFFMLGSKCSLSRTTGASHSAPSVLIVLAGFIPMLIVRRRLHRGVTGQ